MAAIDNLNTAVTALVAKINSINPPVNNDVAIQAAADHITTAVTNLNSKFPD